MLATNGVRRVVLQKELCLCNGIDICARCKDAFFIPHARSQIDHGKESVPFTYDAIPIASTPQIREILLRAIGE